MHFVPKDRAFKFFVRCVFEAPEGRRRLARQATVRDHFRPTAQRIATDPEGEGYCYRSRGYCITTVAVPEHHAASAGPLADRYDVPVSTFRPSRLGRALTVIRRDAIEAGAL